MDLSGLPRHKPLELLPTALDRKAAAFPEKTWASIPNDSNDLTKGFQEIKWRIAANAYNRASWAFENSIGKAPDNAFPTVAYTGPPDLRYFFLLVALVKLGYKVLLMQPAVSVEGQLNLLEKTECHTIIYGDSMSSSLEAILSSKPMTVAKAPSLDELMSEGSPVPTYPFDHTPESYLNNPVMVIHTSGSTGLPKPVVLPFGFLAVNTWTLDFPYHDGEQNNWQCIGDSKRFYIGFPIAHSGGIHVALIVSAYCDSIIVMVQSSYLSGEVMKDAIEYGGARGALAMPRVLIEMAKSEEALKKLELMKSVLWAGGHLPKDVGDAISKRTRLASSWGTTESGSHILHLTKPEDWEYNHFNPTYNNLKWAEVGNNLYEISAMPFPDPKLRLCQKLYWVFPEAKEWPYGDLWSRHPTNPTLWKYEGRKDDMIILDSGHNFHPSYYIREILMEDSRVAAAVILGTGRKNLAVMLELRSDGNAVNGDHDNQSIDALWPLVQKMNARSTALAQCPKENIIIASADKPLPKGAKGDVVPKLAEKLYAAELAKVWDT